MEAEYPVNGMEEKLILERNGFTFSRKLGAGSYGKVVAAYSTKWKKKVAVKILDSKKVNSDYSENAVSRELEIMKSLKHPNIIRTYQVFEMKKNGKYFIVMELCMKGDLLTHIQDQGPLPESCSSRLFLQLCEAVQFLHSQDLVHRDLKCENLLLDSVLDLRVCDFGFSRRMSYSGGRPELSRTYCGTRSYQAPEVLRRSPYDPRVSDVWSMGVVLFVMLYATLPFDLRDLRDMLGVQRRRSLRFPPRPGVSAEAQDLVQRILHPSVEWRISISSILQTSWMRRRGVGENRDQTSTPEPGNPGPGKPPHKEDQEPSDSEKKEASFAAERQGRHSEN